MVQGCNTRVLDKGPHANQILYVYILYSLKDRLFYIGYSGNLRTGVKDYNAGKNVKNRRPLELIFYEAFSSKADALRREAYLKATKGKVALRQMLKEYLKESFKRKD